MTVIRLDSKKHICYITCRTLRALYEEKCSADGRSGKERKIDDTAGKIKVQVSDPGMFPGLSFSDGDEPKLQENDDRNDLTRG